MKDEQTLSTAKFLSASDLAERIARAQDRQTAADMVGSAQAEIDKKTKQAERDAIRQRDMMQSAAKRKISKEMEETRQKSATMAVHEILMSAAKVQQKFDALTPWIEDLVETCLRRIIGTVPDTDVLQHIATEAISQNRRGLKYILRSGADVYEPCIRMVQSLEETEFKGLILDVEIDRNLAPSSVILTSSDGALDISVETQLQAVRQELAAVLGPQEDAD